PSPQRLLLPLLIARHPGANVSAIARGAGMAPSQLFGWRRQARVAGAAIRNEAADADLPMSFERFAGMSADSDEVARV
ncbi:MAG: transposase, partial [Pseudolabrys sp.]